MSYIFYIMSHKQDMKHAEERVMSELSFQEKSAWLLFLSLLLVFGLYFASVLPSESANVRPDQVLLFVGVVVLLVVLQIVGHALLAIQDRRTEADERDRLIALKGGGTARTCWRRACSSPSARRWR